MLPCSALIHPRGAAGAAQEEAEAVCGQLMPKGGWADFQRGNLAWLAELTARSCKGEEVLFV